MSRLLCCLRARRHDMGAALSHPQEGEACDGVVPVAPPTMADVIRERKKKAGGAGLSTLRRRLANAARRPRDNRPDRGCEHARFIRSVVSSWRLAEVFLLCEELEAGAALRDLATVADLAREPAPALHAQLPRARDERWWCDVELCGGSGAGSWSVCAHRCILAARSGYFRDLLARYPPSCLRVPLEGLCGGMSRAECEACLSALYAGTARAHASHAPHAPHAPHSSTYKYDENSEAELDILNGDNSCERVCGCGCAGAGGWGVSPRLMAALRVSRDPLHTSMHYLLDSGEMADTRLVFRLEGGGAAYGFRTALELPCHRVILAARSRFFKSVMSRRGGGGAGGAGGAVCVDEKVLPRRYARALLHAAYTDQVDLSLIGRNTSSPPSTNGNTSAWSGAGRGGAGAGGARPATTAMLDDAFQLYEIARFLEMPIVVQGCEDAVVEALSPDTLPHVLRWAAAPHASHWVHRQAMRYLRDEFTSIMCSAGAARMPRAALAHALASEHLQASEQQVLRAVLKWSADQPPQREPNVVWHTAHSVGRRGARRRSGSDAALREALASLVPLVRTEHLPHDSDLLQQLVRRGIIPSPGPPPAEEGSTADAWLGRGSYRPARCFLPYLDEIKALLEDQAVPEAELARERRARYLHKIPDTLYMVAAARNPESACGSGAETTGAGGTGGTGGTGADAGAGAWLGARTAAVLRARARELRTLPAACTALAHHAIATHTHRQIALRAVREMGLPDACADMLLQDDDDSVSEQNASEWEARGGAGEEAHWSRDDACCRALSSAGAARCASAGSLRAASASASAPAPHEVGAGAGGGARARLSAAVPDVAMAPNANTHLLSHPDYFRHPPPWEYGGVVLQLDLGDGATHTPRPGSRAQRNAPAPAPARAQAMSCLHARCDEVELRAAIEMSLIRTYSSIRERARERDRDRERVDTAGSARRTGGGGGGGSGGAGGGGAPHRTAAATLPHLRAQQHPGASGSASVRHADLPLPTAPTAPAAPALPALCVSPRRRAAPLYRAHHDYRLEAQYGGSASTSRGHSPNNYA